MNITLRPITLADATQRYADWLNDPEVSRFMETRFEVHRLQSLRAYIDNLHPDVLFAIRADGVHIGNIKLGDVSLRHQRANVSLFIGNKNYWGKGIATEAINGAVRIARDGGLKKLEASMYELNIASRCAFNKAGFVVEGRRESAAVFEGARCDIIMMGKVL